MEKQKRWQLFVIIAVCLLTLYNILPTIIFYSKPLKQPVDAAYAKNVAVEISERVNKLEKDALQWVHSFCDLLHVKPTSVECLPDDPSIIQLKFANDKERSLFARFLPKAGSLIPFVPSQMALLEESSADNSVKVLRNVGIRLNEKETDKLYRFAPKQQDGKISDFYFELGADRFASIATQLGGTSPQVNETIAVLDEKDNLDALLFLARKVAKISENFSGTPFAKRFFGSFTQTDLPNGGGLVERLITRMQESRRSLELKKMAISEERKTKEEKGELIDATKLEMAESFQAQMAILDSAVSALQAEKEAFATQVKPLSRKVVIDWLKSSRQKNPNVSATYILPLGQKNPIINEIVLDWASDSITLKLHNDILAIRSKRETAESIKIQQEEISRLLMNELAKLQQSTEEVVVQGLTDFRINLYKLPGAQSVMAMDLRSIAGQVAEQTLSEINREWQPTHLDLVREKLPLLNADSYQKADASQKRLSVLVIAPTRDMPFSGLKHSSIYVILRGVQNIIDQYHRFPGSPEAEVFSKEIQALTSLLQKRGFIGYPGETLGHTSEYNRDFIFELDDYYSTLLKATREDFFVLGSAEYAALEFSDIEQRIIAQNRIDDAIQEDILRAKELYQSSQVGLDPLARYSVPAPTENAYFSNFKRAVKAYFRGDDSRIIRWGLDLSGGKSVRIALLDHTNKPVTDPAMLQQAVNELYNRINKMGVSERTIRIENATIVIDFPGAQGVSASELVKASAMYFHVVNEQFGPYNSALAKEVNEFLQDVWNEAVVTNQKDIESINQIAYNKMSVAASRASSSAAIKDSAQMLYAAGLRLASTQDYIPSSGFDDSVSTIARLRGDDPTEWNFQGHPLMIVFANYALDGSSLENVQTSYDPSKGNVLLFGVKGSYPLGRIHTSASPRDDFYNWTSQFSEEKIVGTTKEEYSKGRGWRMAVILNGAVISYPSLNASLRDHAMISGNFSQREVSKLATDLKAGSLSFTPKILSEQNVSPELGKQERTAGVVASIVAIVLVFACMISYYRFAGIVASVAVLFNMLVIWAVMQNIEMALTLPGIAGMLLTVAMAVDANVLVFERIREEFKNSGRIASAIQLGYRKAFSAIFDANLTTIIASLILLQFDAGPIRGFAVTLVIGIISSMFTALFMTRYFFAGWVQNPDHKELKMAEWIKSANFDFLKFAKPAFILSGVVLLIGAGVLSMNYKSIFGMDFTGGYSLVVDLQENKDGDYREKVSHALSQSGLSSKEYQIRELGRPNLLRIQLGISLEEKGRPFFEMPTELSGDKEQFSYDFQKNPRIVWVVKALEDGGLKIKDTQNSQLASGWTVMSGQFSDAMRNNAIWALSLALLAVLVYIAFRFEWKFAVAAVLGLLHDIILTICVAALANKVGLPVQIDLEVIGALMTIIGYSLNDTIIVFDRVREDMRILRKKSLKEIINHALNTTLSRTLMTSGITLLVLLTLVFLGGKSMFAFSFVMAVGVFLGTLSSLFIAAPILLFLENRESTKRLQTSHA